MTGIGKRLAVAALAAALVAWPVAGARAAVSDAWITTKTKIALLTAKNVHSSGINVDTVDGVVTLHGKVDSAEDKANAEAEAKKISGVREVRNLLQVVPEAFEKSIKASDDAIKKNIEESLKGDDSLKHVKVASVTKGVVVLSGKTETLDQKLRAIEHTWKISGVERVASEIQAGEK